MVITSNPLVTTIETLRDRVRHLEAETAALRSDLDLMLVWANWQAEKRVSSEAIRATQVSDSEVDSYQGYLEPMVYPREVLRRVLQAQKVATYLKHSVKRDERVDVLRGVLRAFNEIALEEGLEVPDELVAVISD